MPSSLDLAFALASVTPFNSPRGGKKRDKQKCKQAKKMRKKNCKR